MIDAADNHLAIPGSKHCGFSRVPWWKTGVWFPRKRFLRLRERCPSALFDRQTSRVSVR